MKTYIVFGRAVTYVEADSETDAIDAANGGEVDAEIEWKSAEQQVE